MRRRTFLQKTTAATLVWFSQKLIPLKARDLHPPILLTILHTNDLHGYVGQTAKSLKEAVAEVRSETSHTLLFDAGDFMPEGDAALPSESVAEWMQEMGYNAVTFGEQERKLPTEQLFQQFNCVNIPVVLSNIGGLEPENENVLNPFQVIEVGSIRVGVIGIEGDFLKKELQWTEIVNVVNKTAAVLKEELGCALVVCLSRLGFCYADNRPSDVLLAGDSRHIDLILGGGTHTFMQEAGEWKNAAGRSVWVSHAGYGGRLLGKLEVLVAPGGTVQLQQSAYLPVSSNPIPII